MFVLLVEASFLPDELYPCLGVSLVLGLEVVISRWRVQAKQVLSAAFSVSDEGNGVQVGKAYLFVQTVLGRSLVCRQEVWAQDKVQLLPLLGEKVTGQPAVE